MVVYSDLTSIPQFLRVSVSLGPSPFGFWVAGYQKLRNLRYRTMMQHWESGIMNVSVGDRWEKFVEQAVKAGRYGSASEVVREGLRLVGRY